MTILLTQLPDNFEEDVRNKLLTKFGIDKAYFNLKLIHKLYYSDLGYDQSKMVTMPNNADLSTIVEKLNTLKD